MRKRDLPSFSLYHSYSYLLTLSNKGETAEDEFQGTISKLKKKKKTLLLVDVLHKKQIVRHFHFLVVKKRQGNVQKNCDTRAKLSSCI